MGEGVTTGFAIVSSVLVTLASSGRTDTGVSVAFEGRALSVEVATASSILAVSVVSGKTDTGVSVASARNELSVEVATASPITEVTFANSGVIEVEFSVSFAGIALSVGSETKEVIVSVPLESGTLVNGIDTLGEAVLVAIDVGSAVEESLFNAGVGNTIAVLFSVGAVVEGAIEVTAVVVGGTATSTVGVPPMA